MYLIFFYVNINIGDCMLVRLGYVAISTAIDVTSSSPYTYSEYLNKCKFVPGRSEYQNAPPNNILSVYVINIKTMLKDIEPA